MFTKLGNYKLNSVEKYMLETEMKQTENTAKLMHSRQQLKLYVDAHKDIKKPEMAVFDIARFKTDF